MQALGIHVFAGGFTAGVQRVMPVKAQLEVHGLGRRTVEEVLKVPFECSTFEDWPRYSVDFAYGNPRCTAFSNLSHGSSTHDPWAPPTRDAVEFCRYVVGNDIPIGVWESVQGAYTTGRPLLEWMRDELFIPNGYRIAHLFLTALTFGNCQNRRRYFFVAYKKDRNFNVCLPIRQSRSLRDVLMPLRERVTREYCINKTHHEDYDENCHQPLSKSDRRVAPYLPQGMGLNKYASERERELMTCCPDHWKVWDRRISNIPFSMHCIRRLSWDRPCPTLHSSAGKFLHPEINRGLTIKELATIMDWKHIPRGELAIQQIVKGVVPAIGEWLAEQVVAYLNDDWGSEDWESEWDKRKNKWVGRHLSGETEKAIRMTGYV